MIRNIEQILTNKLIGKEQLENKGMNKHFGNFLLYFKCVAKFTK